MGPNAQNVPLRRTKILSETIPVWTALSVSHVKMARLSVMRDSKPTGKIALRAQVGISKKKEEATNALHVHLMPRSAPQLAFLAVQVALQRARLARSVRKIITRSLTERNLARSVRKASNVMQRIWSVIVALDLMVAVVLSVSMAHSRACKEILLALHAILVPPARLLNQLVIQVKSLMVQNAFLVKADFTKVRIVTRRNARNAQIIHTATVGAFIANLATNWYNRTARHVKMGR